MARVVGTYILISYTSGEKAQLKRKHLKKAILKHLRMGTNEMIKDKMK